MAARERTAGYILIVDDDDEVRKSLSSMLQALGYQVATAAHGIEALDHLERNPLPRLILLDLQMPTMNGWVFRMEQQKDPRLAKVPVVVLSGMEDPEPAADFLNANAHLTKPLDPDALLATVEEYMR